MARLGSARLCRSHERACSRDPERDNPGSICFDALGSQGHLALHQTATWPCADRLDQPSLVRRRTAGRRPALLGQLFWLSQPATLHVSREQPPSTLVVFWGDFGCGFPALHPPVAPRAGANPAPFKPEACNVIRPTKPKVVSAEFRQLLAYVSTAAVHHRSHQASELLDSGNAGCCHSHRPCSKAFRTKKSPHFGLGLGLNNRAHVCVGGGILEFIDLGSSHR